MHEGVLGVGLVWAMVLAGLLVRHAARASTAVARVLALEVLSLVMVAAIAMVAIGRGRQGDLHVALVVALLGFAQTLAACRLVGRPRGDR